jgi:hypothetical protein
MWVRFMPEACPWCGSATKPGSYGAGTCNNSWHKSHPDHKLLWPTWVWQEERRHQ